MTTDYRALCAELLDELELWSSWHDATDLKDRAGAALHFTQPEPQPPAAIVEMVNKLHQINNPAALAQPEPVARPEDEYHEDMGAVLWWRFPIDEPPYCGSPLDSEWPGYHTHFTPLGPMPIPANNTKEES
jgi:hypothetical protein